MILFSIGLPGRFADWCDALIVGLVERQLGSVQAVPLNGLDELATAVVRTKTWNLVACCRQPMPRLQTEILQAERPFLVALGDPRAALRDLVERGSPVVEATRSVASSCAAMRVLATAPGALVLTEAVCADPAATARAAADHFGLGLGEDLRLQAIRDLSSVACGPAGARDGDWQEGVGEREQAIINGALLPYVTAMSNAAELAPLVWERELFYLSDDPPAEVIGPATRPVDLTGRARIVIYGPFIALPPGSWSADVVLAFSAETAGMSFLVEAYAGRQLAHSRIESSGAQVIDVTLHFTITGTLDQLVEVRVITERASFEGQLALGRVTLRPEREVDSATKDYLTKMLQA